MLQIQERREWGVAEQHELLLFSGNDDATIYLDRIRLRASAILFDTDPTSGNNRGTENIRMTIDRVGNVGIANISPTYKLDVSGDINFTGDLYKNGTLFSPSSSSLWTTNGSKISYNSGNVGIGTSDPTANIEIKSLQEK